MPCTSIPSFEDYYTTLHLPSPFRQQGRRNLREILEEVIAILNDDDTTLAEDNHRESLLQEDEEHDEFAQRPSSPRQ